MTAPDPTRAERAYYGDGPMRWWQFWRPHWPCPDPPRIFPSGRQGATMSDGAIVIAALAFAVFCALMMGMSDDD